MILVIPSIDLLSGCSTLPMVGRYTQVSKNPVELSMLFRKENAKTIHINNLNSLSGSDNQHNIETLLNIVDSVEIPIQYYSQFNSFHECEELLDQGIHRIVIDKFFIENTKDVSNLIKKYSSSRIAFYAKVDSNISKKQCLNVDINIDEYIQKIKIIGGDRIIYEDMSWFINLNYNIKYINELTNNHRVKTTLFDSAMNYKDLNYININSNIFVDSIILGKSLYENNFPCQAIWRIAESRFDN